MYPTITSHFELSALILNKLRLILLKCHKKTYNLSVGLNSQFVATPKVGTVLISAGNAITVTQIALHYG